MRPFQKDYSDGLTPKLTRHRCFFLLGGPIVVAIYQIPQMFQIVYGFDGLDSGVRVVPFTLCWSTGIIVASVVAGRLKVPPVYIILTGACLQIVGFALMSKLPLTLEAPPQIYGYQVIAGLGCGMVLPLLFVMIPFVVGDRDRGECDSNHLFGYRLTHHSRRTRDWKPVSDDGGLRSSRYCDICVQRSHKIPH